MRQHLQFLFMLAFVALVPSGAAQAQTIHHLARMNAEQIKSLDRLDVLAQSTVAESGQAPDERSHSRIAEAKALYSKGRDYQSKGPQTGGALANIRKAIELYEQAVVIDPQFAEAYVSLAEAWSSLSFSVPDGSPRKVVLPKAKAAALKAIQLDGTLAGAHTALANIYFGYDFAWAQAENEFKRAIELAPGDAASHARYGLYLAALGKFDEGLAELRIAEDIDRSDFTTNISLAQVYYWLRRDGEAAEHARAAIERNPKNAISHFFLGFIELQRHMFEEAIAEFKISFGTAKDGGSLSGLAYAYAVSGNKTEAAEILKDLKAEKSGARLVPYRVAAVYLALNDRDNAIEWLKKDFEMRDNWMNRLKVDPVMDPLRSDPRFRELMRRMKLGQ